MFGGYRRLPQILPHPYPPTPHNHHHTYPASSCHADLTMYRKNAEFKLKMVKPKNKFIFINFKNMNIFNNKIMTTLKV
jgi:hypothetical protein